MPTKESDTIKRVIYFDILNILACLGVVLLHHNGVFWQYDGSGAWAQSLVVEVVFYYAVPIFLMLSGATLLNYRKKYDTKTFFKKRFTKILIPFVVWAIIAFIYRFAIGQMTPMGPRSLLNAFFGNAEMSIYYFMFLILGIYLAMPIFSKIIDHDEKNGRKVLWYAVILMFVAQSFLPIVLKLLGIEWNTSLTSQISSIFIFVFLGYLLSTTNLQKRTRILVYIAAILSCIFRYIGIFILSTQDNTTATLLTDYSQFHSVLLAAAIFIFVKEIKWQKYFKTAKSRNLLATLAGCSFGVYLIHMFIMDFEAQLFHIDAHSFVWRIIWPFVTYGISITLVLTCKKIPYLRRIVP